MSEQAPDSPSVRITETTESVTSSHDSPHGESWLNEPEPFPEVPQAERDYDILVELLNEVAEGEENTADAFRGGHFGPSPDGSLAAFHDLRARLVDELIGSLPNPRLAHE